MPKVIPRVDLSERNKKAVDAVLKEADHVVSEIRGIQDTQRRTIVLIPPAITVGLPLLLRPSNEIPNILSSSILFGFGFMFALMAVTYIGQGLAIVRMANYLLDHVGPNLNTLLGRSKADLFYWEEYSRLQHRGDIVSLAGFSLAHFAQFTLLIAPSLGSIALAFYFAHGSMPSHVLGVALAIYLVLLVSIFGFGVNTAREARRARR